MSKKIYVIPFWSRVAIFIADHLPSRVRASVYIDTLDSLDDHYEDAEQHDKTSITYFQAVNGVRVETLRREAYKDGLHCTTKEVPHA